MRKGKEKNDKELYFSARCAIRHDQRDDWYAERVVPDDIDGWHLDSMDRRCDSYYYPELFLYYRSLFCSHYSSSHCTEFRELSNKKKR